MGGSFRLANAAFGDNPFSVEHAVCVALRNIWGNLHFTLYTLDSRLYILHYPLCTLQEQISREFGMALTIVAWLVH